MYKLYGNVAGWKELHRSHEEMDIAYEMGKYIDGHTPVNFIINKEIEGTDIIYKTIKTNKEYILYLQEVTQRYMQSKKEQKEFVKVKKK